MPIIPNFVMIQEAMTRVKGIANHTPVITSRTLNRLTGYQIFLKCENFQRTGSFKFRGAYNAISQLTPEQKQRGVVVFSSGNHAQGVALAGQLSGVHTVSCMPSDVSMSKAMATEAYGSELLFYDRYTEDREEIVRRLSEERELTFLSPFDHPHVIAGAGTATLELLEEVGELDAIVTPVGGGGLISGISLAAHGINPAIRVFGVEPEGADDMLLSLQAGERVTIQPPNTIADGLRTPSPGKLTFPLVQEHVEEIVTVRDQEIIATLQFVVSRLKLVIEPSSAVPLAALLTGRLPVEKGRRVGVIISGGNVDLQTLVDVMGKEIGK